ncbi:unnamed protein product [Darwinula stevensoni]|uniref:Peptidase M14 domain-containing protein n=1 Tax=Darwinula stevensoni TaxID=69355 RepID=A0A7R8X527_9CRUS|nr:unnamed protein product [Darwinula stevensoni]CAG0886689.1 unnamed protein product [Darwinula stevensoni]
MKLLVLLLAAFAAAERVRYDGYEVKRVFPKESDDLRHLAELRHDNRLDFWTEVQKPYTDIMVPPQMVEELEGRLRELGLPFMTIIRDVQKLSDEQKVAEPNEDGTPRAMDWTSYHRLVDIHGYMDQLAEDYPDMVTVMSIGSSYEDRDMKLIKVSTGSATQKMWIDGGIHAREWIAPAVVTYILRELVENYEENRDVVDLYDWYLLPLHNPDGYEYSHTNARLWRKTRSRWSGSCVGVDPNRNWDYHWMEQGASSDPCSEIYAGPEPFSEPETRSAADFIMAENADESFVGFFTVHSYGQYWLCPWGYDYIYPDDYDDLEDAGMTGVNALEDVHGTQFTFGPSAIVLYAAAGGSDDWAKGVGNIKYSYTLELRDTGFWGFELPASQIVPTGQETWEGIKAFARYFQ